jgi:DNA primase
MLLAEQKEKERARQREENRASVRPVQTYGPSDSGAPVPPEHGPDVPPPSYDDYMPSDYDAPAADMPAEPVVEGGIVITEPHLAPCEKELLGFILEEGCTELEFDRDSKYYVEGETVNVAEFIDGILADDEADFVNPSYRKVYQEYFRMYDEGLPQSTICRRLMDNMDPEISAVARDLLIEKHQLTVKNYEQSLTSVSTRLVIYVPKTLLTYQVKKVEIFLKELTSELAHTDDPQRQIEIMTRIGEYNKARTRLNKELGRV